MLTSHGTLPNQLLLSNYSTGGFTHYIINQLTLTGQLKKSSVGFFVLNDIKPRLQVHDAKKIISLWYYASSLLFISATTPTPKFIGIF